MTEARIARAVASPDGAFYLVGQAFEPDSDADATLWKVSPDGEMLWTARWGNALGWNDYVYDGLATSEQVAMTGTAARYEGQEYWSEGHSFVRTYSHGGVVRWTWEDVEGATPTSNVRRPKMLVPSGEDLVLVSRAYSEEGSDVLQVATLSAEGELVSRWTDSVFGIVLAARVDDAGDVWVLLRSGAGWLGHWRGDGEFVESFSADAPNVSAQVVSFGRDGSVAIAGERSRSAGDQLVVRRMGAGLEAPLLAPFDAGGGEFWDFGLDIAIDCANVAWVTAQVEPGRYPIGGFGPDATQLWTVDGLETVAISDEGVAITAGYDPASETTLVRWLRPQ